MPISWNDPHSRPGSDQEMRVWQRPFPCRIWWIRRISMVSMRRTPNLQEAQAAGDPDIGIVLAYWRHWIVKGQDAPLRNWLIGRTAVIAPCKTFQVCWRVKWQLQLGWPFQVCACNKEPMIWNRFLLWSSWTWTYGICALCSTSGLESWTHSLSESGNQLKLVQKYLLLSWLGRMGIKSAWPLWC